ncbi:MAG: hypothetical protein NTZ49_01095 [Candidatus Parcubacteria bacterium]|nr:hypothetical protein [Candidatus Parcubacteria bacterium]
MHKIIIWGIVLSLVLAPFQAWSSPGPIDQYGGHACFIDCGLFGLTWNEYHYHELGNPGYLRGSYQKPNYSFLFYQPNVAPINETVQETIVKESGLIENINMDNDFCSGETIFSQGLYDSQNRVRVKPVCVGDELGVKAKEDLGTNNYYADIPSNEIATITKVYHINIGAEGKKIFTDRPELSELKGSLIRGNTDNTLYYVYPFSSELTIRPISDNQATLLLGNNYNEKIIYFDDSIIYTYKIGEPLN